MNRREFMGAGAAATAICMTGPALAMTARSGSAIVVFDARFEEARHFARFATEQYGLRASGFVEDITALWQNQLTTALNAGTAIIGMTAGGARFCLQMMAGPGVRVVHHVTHAEPFAALQHICWTGANNADRDLRCSSAWPEEAARIAINQDSEKHGHAVGLQAPSKYPTHHLPAPECLESWVLAPAPAARRADNRLLAEWNS